MDRRDDEGALRTVGPEPEAAAQPARQEGEGKAEDGAWAPIITNPRVIGILLLYSPQYAERAVAEFARLLDGVGKPNVLIAVCNNPALDRTAITASRVLAGDNSVHEFSGWQTGLDACRNAGLDAPLYVFANDTFCHHRPFGWLETWAFRSGFRRLACRKKAELAGETFELHEAVALDGQAFPGWVSTYLFALNRAGLERLDWRIAPPRATLDAYVAGGTDKAGFFTDRLSENLRRHLSRWLFEPEHRYRWRHAAPLDAANAEMMAAKARAIVAEKLLSAQAAAGGFGIEGVYRPLRVRLVRRLRNRLAPQRR